MAGHPRVSKHQQKAEKQKHEKVLTTTSGRTSCRRVVHLSGDRGEKRLHYARGKVLVPPGKKHYDERNFALGGKLEKHNVRGSADEVVNNEISTLRREIDEWRTSEKLTNTVKDKLAKIESARATSDSMDKSRSAKSSTVRKSREDDHRRMARRSHDSLVRILREKERVNDFGEGSSEEEGFIFERKLLKTEEVTIEDSWEGGHLEGERSEESRERVPEMSQRCLIAYEKEKDRWFSRAPTKRKRRSSQDSSYRYNPAKSPLEAWQKLFSNDLCEIILKYTNEEIDRYNENKGGGTAESRNASTKILRMTELKAFFGIMYFSGVKKDNNVAVDELWSLEFGSLLYRNTMSCRRFEFIGARLRFDDRISRVERTKNDPLAAIREIWEIFIDNCQSHYNYLQDYYNDKKCVIDVPDKLYSDYTCARQTDRCTMRFFMRMLDQAGLNGCILYNFPMENHAKSRRTFLKELALSLVTPFLNERILMPGLHKFVRECIAQVIQSDQRTSADRTDKLGKRKRCSICPNNSDKKTSFCCVQCKKPVCDVHRLSHCVHCSC